MNPAGSVLYNGIQEKVGNMALKVASGLTQKELDFVTAYLEHDGDNVKAMQSLYPNYTRESARVDSYKYLRRKHVQDALTRTLKIETLNTNWIGAKFKQLATKGTTQDVQLRATRELAKMVGVYAQPDGGGGLSGSGVTINISVPGATVQKSTPIDVDFVEV